VPAAHLEASLSSSPGFWKHRGLTGPAGSACRCQLRGHRQLPAVGSCSWDREKGFRMELGEKVTWGAPQQSEVRNMAAEHPGKRLGSVFTLCRHFHGLLWPRSRITASDRPALSLILPVSSLLSPRLSPSPPSHVLPAGQQLACPHRVRLGVRQHPASRDPWSGTALGRDLTSRRCPRQRQRASLRPSPATQHTPGGWQEMGTGTARSCPSARGARGWVTWWHVRKHLCSAQDSCPNGSSCRLGREPSPRARDLYGRVVGGMEGAETPERCFVSHELYLGAIGKTQKC